MKAGQPTRVVLPNGLTILTVTRPESPLVAVLLMYRAGSLYDPHGATGLAHLTEHMMFRGTAAHPHGEIDRLTGSLGGTNNAMTTGDHALYYFVLPSAHWKMPLAVEADRMTRCELDASALKTERTVAIEERKMLDDDPEARVYEAVDALAIDGHPYRYPVVGLPGDLERLSVNDVRSFYRDRYRPDNAVLAVVGGVSHEEVTEEASRLFGHVTPEGSLSEPVFQQIPATGPRHSVVRDGSGTSRIVLAFPTPGATDVDAAALELLANLLAAGRSSRLYTQLVGGTQLATEISASKLLQRDPGLFYVSATLHSGVDPLRCEEKILELLAELASIEISGDELSKLKNLARVDAILSSETCLGEAGNRAFWEHLGGWQLGDRYDEALQGVESGDLRRVAGRHLDPNLRSSVWLVP